MPRTILVADDDQALRALLRRSLCAQGFCCVLAQNGKEALELIRASPPDLVLLDVEMPGLDGYEVCRRLKRSAATRALPVIIMSGARRKDKDVVTGLFGGADDYVLKPFILDVLQARIQAVLRRTKPTPRAAARLKKCGLALDGGARSVRLKGKLLRLTRKEFDLLAALVSGAGKLRSIGFLLKTVWGYDPETYSNPATVEVHVSHLRKKLGPQVGKRIVSVVGHGYRFEA